MPPKRASNKKLQTKLAVASSEADAEILNNGVKELGEIISVDSKSLTNGSENLEADLQETTIVKSKRSTGRGKATAPIESEQQMIVDKKPAAKGRGKKKNEIEVIQNEKELKQEAKVEVAEAEAEAEAVGEKQAEGEVVTKIKGKGKKSESKVKMIKASKPNEKIQDVEEVQEELMAEAEISVVEKPGKKSKVMLSKRKKQDANEIQIENEEAKQEEIKEEPIEKGMHFF